MLSAIVSVFMQQLNRFMQNNKLYMLNTEKYEIYDIIVRCTHFSQENKMHTSQHQCIHYRKPSVKIRLLSRNVQGRVYIYIPCWHQRHFMQTIRLYMYSSWYTHKRYETHQHCEVHTLFSAKQHVYMTTSIYPLQETFT